MAKKAKSKKKLTLPDRVYVWLDPPCEGDSDDELYLNVSGTEPNPDEAGCGSKVALYERISDITSYKLVPCCEDDK